MPTSRTRIDADPLLIVGAALADGRSEVLRRGVSLLIEGDLVAGMWFDGDQPRYPPEAEVIDATGATLVPAMVDSHSHLSMPGGAQWVQRGFDAAETLLAVAEENGEMMIRAGVRWARDVGAPQRLDPATGAERAISLQVRDAWRGRRDRPYIRAAGTWIARDGALPHGLAIEVDDGDRLLLAARKQLDDGADLVKLYLDGPDRDTPPFTANEVARVVAEAHARGARVAAHASVLHGAKVGAAARVDSIEHGFELDGEASRAMAAGGVVLVSTLGVLHSQLTFVHTSLVERFTQAEARSRIQTRLEIAEESVRNAQAAGVTIAAGSDFGGGSLRANQLAWEAEALVRAGMPPHEALAALTWRGGDLLGEPSAGRLTVGGRAHFSLIHGDPLTEPAALWRVWLTR